MTAMASDFDSTLTRQAARRAVAESKRGRKSTERIVEASSGMLATIAQAHAGPDYFVERLRAIIKGD